MIDLRSQAHRTFSNPRSADVVSTPCFEPVEPRLLLDGTAFATDLPEAVAVDPGNGAVTVGIDGFDPEGDALTVSVESTSEHLQLHVPQNNRFARLVFVGSDGVTVIGTVVVQLFETRSAPATERFITLATNEVADDGTLNPDGTPFYSMVPVHRIIDDFMIQTGDPVNGNGSGGSPLGSFDDVFDPNLSFWGKGVLAMANSGPDTNDSQFFITEWPTTWLNQKHMILGQVISGFDVLQRISEVETEIGDRPAEMIYLHSVEIFENSQDHTVTITPTPYFTGEATVTVTLDDGQGNTATQTILVAELDDLGARPITSPIEAVSTVRGQETTFTVVGSDDTHANIDYTIEVDPSLGVTASVDSDTGEVTISGAQNYTGLHTASIYTVEDGFWNVKPSKWEFNVVTGSGFDPKMISHAIYASNAISRSATVFEDRLYVGSNDVGTEIFDISDPANPQYLGAYGTPGHVYDVVVTRLDVEGESRVVAITGDLYEGIRLLDVTDPTQISLLDQYEVGEGTVVPRLVLVDQTLYAPNVLGGLIILDVSDPTNVAELSVVKTLDEDQGLALRAVTDVAVNGNFAYVVDIQSAAVIVLDISDPTAPQFVHGFSSGAAPWGVAYQNGVIYISDQQQGMAAFDVTNPSVPLALGAITIPSAPWWIDVQGDLAIVSRYTPTGEPGFSFVDISNPRQMYQTYDFMLPSTPSGKQNPQPNIAANNLQILDENTVLLAADKAGTVLLDISALDDSDIFTSKTFNLSGGRSVAIQLKGPGSVILRDSQVGGADLGLLQVTGSTDKTSLLIKTKGGDVTIEGILVHGDIKQIVAKTTDLLGDLTVVNGIKKLYLDDVADDHLINIGTATNGTTAVKMFFGTLAETVIDSESPISKLSTGNWLGGSLTAPWAGVIDIDGNLDANLTLTGSNNGMAVKKFDVEGLIINCALSATAGFVNKAIVGQWDDGGLLTRWVKNLKTTGVDPARPGDFGAEIALDGTDAPNDVAIKNAKIAGKVTSNTWAVTGGAKKVMFAESDPNWSATFSDEVKNVKVTGNAQAGLAGHFCGQWTSLALGVVNVVGDLYDTIITLTESAGANALNKMVVKGWIGASTAGVKTALLTAADVGKIICGAVRNASLFAGVGLTADLNADQVFDLPDPDGEVNIDSNNRAVIQQLKVKGLPNIVDCFTNANVAAAEIKKAIITRAATNNGGQEFGIAADEIGMVKLITANSVWKEKGLKGPGDSETFGDHEIRLV